MTGYVEKVKNKLRTDDLLFDLFALGLGAAVVAMPALGAAAIFVKQVEKHTKRYSRSQLRNSFYALKRQGYIAVGKKGEVHFSPKARTVVEIERIKRNFSEKRKQVWNKRWCIVLFDIPNRKRSARDALRHLLKRLGFIQMQKSTWLFPFSCQKEIADLKKFFMLNDREVRVIETESIGEDREYRRLFSLP